MTLRIKHLRQALSGFAGCVVLIVAQAFNSVAIAPIPPSDGVTLVSISSTGAAGNAASDNPAISANGRVVVFSSAANNLVDGDRNHKIDVFAHDRFTGKTTLLSAAADGTHGNDASYTPYASADGRLVVFASDASNLVSGDGNKASDIFLRDQKSGKTERISAAPGGKDADGASRGPSISADGRFVTFASFAGNLVSGDTNGKPDVFVHDRQTGKTRRASISSRGVQGDANAYFPRLSADGQVVAFISDATTLVSGDTNKVADVFVHDLKTGQTTRISLASDGKQADGPALDFPALSTDGRYVAFTSEAKNLVSGDTNGKADIFLHDRQTGKTARVSLSSSGKQSSGSARQPALSADGSLVAFTTDAVDLTSGDANHDYDVYLHNLKSGKTALVSAAANSKPGDKMSIAPAISADGLQIAFASEAGNLVSKDTNGKSDIFVCCGAL